MLVIGASGGIGSAVVAEAGQRYGANRVTGVSRQSHPGFDLRDEASIAELADALRADDKRFHLIFDATGVLQADGRDPEKSFRQIEPDAMATAFAINATGPALLMKHVGPLLDEDTKAVFATISARIGSIGDNGLGGWVSYRASKAALNQIVRTYAIELARSHPEAVCVALHPGTVESALSRPYARGNYTFSADDCAVRLMDVIDGLTPNESGGFFDYSGEPIPW